MDAQLRERITANPNVMVGKPVIRGTRIPVEMIVRMLASGVKEDELLKEYPRLTSVDIKAAVGLASAVSTNEDVRTVDL